MSNPTPQVLISCLKARIIELERLHDLQLSRGANVGRNHLMSAQARHLHDESYLLLNLIKTERSSKDAR